MNNNKEKKYILFSPIGSHDPIGIYIDGVPSKGSMLSIISHYKPEIVYLYLTKELKELSDNYYIDKLGGSKNLYEYSINQLYPDCQCYSKCGDEDDVHNYDVFIEEFRKHINEIHENHKDYEILLNVSSGTPAMKLTLLLETINTDIKLIPVQVETPKKMSNSGKKFNYKADYDSYINEIDKLKNSNFEGKCIEVEKLLILKKTKIQSQIESLIKNYEYSSALTLLKSDEISKQLFNDDLIKYLKHASYRINLKYDKANEKVKLDKKQYNNDCIEFIEYYYVMKIKLKKREFSDFILRISPFLTEILFYFLRKNVAALNRVLEIINGDKKIRVNASPDQKFIDYMNIKVKNLQDGNFITFYILIFIYDFYAKNNQKLNSIIDKKLLDELRKIEKEIRNKVAHKMINIDEDFIKDKVGCNSNDILSKCEEILKAVFPEFDKNYFVFFYINEEIEKILQKP